MLWRDLQQNITNYLSRITLADLVEQQKNVETPFIALQAAQTITRNR
jgi:DNA-binding IscR family transcriptional regulator